MGRVEDNDCLTLEAIVGQVATDLQPYGLDIVHPFSRSWVQAESGPECPLPVMAVADPLGLLIANSRRMWSPFMQAMCAGDLNRSEPHPLDRWVATAISTAASRISAPVEVRFSWEPPPRRVALQHVAHRTGLAHLGPAHLCVHPCFGPWIGLRAVIMIDVPGPAEPLVAPDPCTACSKPCMVALQDAAESTGDEQENWRQWAKVREVCPEGNTQRYSVQQLSYHYTHDAVFLRTEAR